MDKCPFGHELSYPEEQSGEIMEKIKKSDEAEGVESIFDEEELQKSFESTKPGDKISFVGVSMFCPICEKSYPASECHSDTTHPFGTSKLS